MKPYSFNLARTRAGLLVVLVPLMLAPACTPDAPTPDPDPQPGTTDFVSADGVAGQDAPEDGIGEPPPAAPPEDDDGRGDRTVEEGDIYRVLGGGSLLNLNSFRGLQVIDISDVSKPEITGRLQVTGSPVEMYVVGDRAIVLMNNWRGYYGQRDDVVVDSEEGGLVMMVDISDRTAPVALAQAHVPGWIQTSRLTQGGGQAALYVAASEYGEFTNPDGVAEYGTRTVVKSFDVSGDAIAFRTQLDLGGYVTAIQATTDVLLVARNHWGWNGGEQSEVTVIDITSPDGTMIEGDTVETAGYVQSQFHMDFYLGMLRVFSGPRWSDGTSSHLETWNASSLATLVPVDDELFGTGDNLYAAIFLGNKAFAVTYLRIDPFHAFSVSDDGQVTEVSEYEVTGWNDFFRPVLDDTRLIGIGINDENGWKLAVSLYDITDLANPEPMMARAEISGESGGWTWSEANWDHRAFSVLQGAVAVQAETGELETGLVLLPFSGWNDESGYTSGVQIYTFSSNTLTRRGIMQHDTPVRRTFLTDSDTAANLSEAELSLFDPTNPDAPVELGSVALAPNYTQVLDFGSHRARVISQLDWYYGVTAELPLARVEIIPATEHADSATAVASFEIPARAQVYKMGDLLVSVASEALDTTSWPYTYETTIDVFDLSDPRTPVRRGSMTSDDLASSYYGGGWYGDCFDCGWWGYQPFDVVNVVGNALTFLKATPQQQPLGTETVCTTYVQDENAGCPSDGECKYSYYTGGYDCRRLNNGPETCTGGFYYCTYDSSAGDTECESVEQDDVDAPIYESCNTYQAVRYWQSYEVQSVDLSNPDAPVRAASVELPSLDEGVSVLAHDDTLYLTVKRPFDVPNDPKPYVRYYVKAIDYSNPSDPDLRPGVNVPGELIAVAGDEIYTRNLVWGESEIETAIARLEMGPGLAYLRGHHRFANREVSAVAIDERGLALVTHRPAWGWGYNTGDNAKLTILSAQGQGLTEVSEVEVDSWADMRDVVSNRVLFQVPGGLLVFDIENAAQPRAQAYFATPGWPSSFVVAGERVLFAAGNYGIYDFSLDTFNLLPPQ
jgi:Beta propeller domain